MQVQELSVQPLHHNDTLNPLLWDGEHLRREVRYKLLQIAKHFAEFLNVDQLNLKDITVSGSNASYGYSKYSDIDLHLVVEHVVDREELYQAKKNQYNFTYDITLKDIPVELYVQDSKQPHHSAGIYSVLDNKWLSKPNPDRPKTHPTEIKSKARNFSGLINQAIRSEDLERCRATMEEIRRLRKAGLERSGEDSVENLAFKLLRARGQIDKLRKYITKLESAELSLGEHNED